MSIHRFEQYKGKLKYNRTVAITAEPSDEGFKTKAIMMIRSEAADKLNELLPNILYVQCNLGVDLAQKIVREFTSASFYANRHSVLRHAVLIEMKKLLQE